MCLHCVGMLLLGLLAAWHEWREHLAWRFPNLSGAHKRLWCRLFGHGRLHQKFAVCAVVCTRCFTTVRA